MNTQNFKPMTYKGDASWHFMFKAQTEIFHKYMEREKVDSRNLDFDINCYEDQRLIKDFLQIRFVEELNEATLDLDHYDHFEEEMIDALNFLMEVYIIYGWRYGKELPLWIDCSPEFETKDIPWHKGTEFMAWFYQVIEKVGAACNLLKNRPWKESQYLVDLELFEPLLRQVWEEFNTLCIRLDLSKQRLFEVWSQKYQVNVYRLSTNY